MATRDDVLTYISEQDSSPTESSSVDASDPKSSDEVNYEPNFLQGKLFREAPTVIMPLDVSSHSLYCLTFYVKYIHKPGDKIHVCYVAEEYKTRTTLESSSTKLGVVKKSRWNCGCMSWLKRLLGTRTLLESMGPSPGVMKQLEREDLANFKAIRAKVNDVFRANGVWNWDVTKITGPDPWTAIIDFREEKRGTMIMLGSRGLGVFKRSILGSVSEKVLRKSLVPVLIVRIPLGALSAVPDPVHGSQIF